MECAMERMFGATRDAAPVTRSVDVSTTSAVGTSAAATAPLCTDGPGRSMRETTAASGSAPASATEVVPFFVDDDFVHPAYDSGGRGTTRARDWWRGANTPCSRRSG